jgi:hypothetical protein
MTCFYLYLIVFPFVKCYIIFQRKLLCSRSATERTETFSFIKRSSYLQKTRKVNKASRNVSKVDLNFKNKNTKSYNGKLRSEQPRTL